MIDFQSLLNQVQIIVLTVVGLLFVIIVVHGITKFLEVRKKYGRFFDEERTEWEKYPFCSRPLKRRMKEEEERERENNMKRDKKGISYLLSILLIIMISIASILLFYSWSGTLQKEVTESASVILGIENVRFFVLTNYYISITVRNTGIASCKIDTLYVNNQRMSYSPTDLPSDLKLKEWNTSSLLIKPKETIDITVYYEWTEGDTYTLKVVTEKGTTVEITARAVP